MLVGELVEDRDELIGVDAAGQVDGVCLAGVLVDYVQQLDLPAVSGDIELEVDRPDVPGTGRAMYLACRLPDTPAFAPFGRPFEPFFAPQPLNALAVDPHALLAKMTPRGAIPPPRVLATDRPKAIAKLIITATRRRVRSALRGAMLPGDPARPPLRHREPVHHHPDCPAPARRAQNSPFAISFNIWISNT